MAAVEKKAQSWQLLESLRDERILHGISQDGNCAVEHNLHRPSRSWSVVSISGSPPVIPSPSKFKRVASNGSTPSCDSFSAFPFDVDTSPNCERRNTVTGDQIIYLDKSSLQKQRHSTPTVPPMRSPVFHPKTCRAASAPVNSYPLWQRTASLTMLAERHYDASPLLENFKSRLASGQRQMTGSCLSIENSNHSDYSNSDSSPRLHMTDVSSCPMEDNDTDSITDDGGSIPPTFTVSPPMSQRSMNTGDTSSEFKQKHCRTFSQPLSLKASCADVVPSSPSEIVLDFTSSNSALSWSEFPRSSSPECGPGVEHGSRQSGHQGKPRVWSNEKEKSSHSFVDENMASPGSSLSLMSEIIQELKRSSQHMQKKLESKPDVPATKAGSPSNSFSGWPRFGNSLTLDHWHRSASRRSSATVQLAKIREDNEDRLEETDFSATYSGFESFSRNSNLRKSKSSFELSFNQRRPMTKPLSPLITNLQRTAKQANRRFASSVTWKEEEPGTVSLPNEKSPSALTKKPNIRQDPKSAEERKGKDKDHKKKTKVPGTPQSHQRRGLINLFKGKWFSMENMASGNLEPVSLNNETPIKMRVPNGEKARRYLVVLPSPHNDSTSPILTDGVA